MIIYRYRCTHCQNSFTMAQNVYFIFNHFARKKNQRKKKKKSIGETLTGKYTEAAKYFVY